MPSGERRALNVTGIGFYMARKKEDEESYS